MSWLKAIIIGFCIYVGVYFVSFVVFVYFGLGYRFSNLANKIAAILEFELGNKNYSIFLSALFWTMTIAVVIKIISFYVKK
ncbi:MAG TPA: hypothetical protein PL155_04945 [Candidatus Omnitrophota bacterium]|nr:hypothetical protein [Candidatus Omnitrophota bacterium]HPD84174.1 hypothetical protein [Candidatus Omnitrophota bacterium]HRZ03031.1 hypothetical protein [Candidatus Omnitrophota bacterium]